MTFEDGNISFLVAEEQQLQPPLNYIGNKSTLCSVFKEYCYCVSNHVSTNPTELKKKKILELL